MQDINTSGSQGPATDRYNEPVIDPTKNVLDLVAAAIQRMDDVLALNIQRQDDMREAESRHVREISGLRAEYQQELRQAETERVNAIRAVDVAAVQQAAAAAEVRATALAAQVAASAEAMRSQVTAAATAAATSLTAALEPVQKDIADLRRAQYEAQGQKTQVIERQAEGTEGRSQSTLVLGIALGIVTLIMAAITVYALTRPAVSAVIYLATQS